MIKLFIFLLLISCAPLKAEPIKIASWNIAWLGSHKFNTRNENDYALLRRYAVQLDADVIALQEVENSEWASKVFGDEYNYYFSTRNNAQRVGVAVKKSTGYNVSFVEYKALNVGYVRHGVDITLTKDNKSLRLLAVHLKSGCFDKPLDTNSVNLISNTKTKKSCSKLSNQIDPLEKWIDERAKENLPYVVLGDFNRRFAIEIQKSFVENQGLWQAIDDEGNENLWSPTLNQNSQCWGGYYKDYIDHIILDPRSRSMYIKGSFNQLIFDGKYSKDLSRSISDHCPISIELDLVTNI